MLCYLILLLQWQCVSLFCGCYVCCVYVVCVLCVLSVQWGVCVVLCMCDEVCSVLAVLYGLL